MKYSIVIPVYKNAESISRLISVLTEINNVLLNRLEVVFVVDGSPDDSYHLICKGVKEAAFNAQVLGHSRNFGSFAAIRTGLINAKGQYFGVMAADLQEPPELLLSFFDALDKDEADVVIGTRIARQDPWTSRIASSFFWGVYKKIVVKDMPRGGVDIFGCNLVFRNQLLQLEESRSSLVALIFWLGFRRKFIAYERLERIEGTSSWTFSKKIDYMLDSIFAFTDYPIRLLIRIGVIGTLSSAILGLAVLSSALLGRINVPGYAATILIVLFFGMLNLLGLGLVGMYAWRGYENSKQRPLAIVAMNFENGLIQNAEY